MLSQPISPTTTQDSIRLYSAEQSKQLDQTAIHQHAIPSLLLMKRAAWFSWQVIQQQTPNIDKIIILCGTGNNGGDGFMIAQYAKLAGLETTVYLYGAEDKIANDAKQTYREWQAIHGLTLPLETLDANEADQHTLIVDALFGTGLTRKLKPSLVKILKKLAHTDAAVCAVDIPSGLQTDSGLILGYALPADFTCTFITHKFGFYCQQGPDVCGEIFFSDLNLSSKAPEVFGEVPQLAHSHSLKHWSQQLGKRTSASHKGIQGSALLLGGNHSMLGAIQLAAGAAIKSGCGLCKVISRSEHLAIITGQQPEIMSYHDANSEALIQQASAVGIGPGLGTDEWAQNLFRHSLHKPQQTPLVIDADALNLLLEHSSWQKQDNIVYTPHLGEAARLLECTVEEIQQDRVVAIKSLQQKYGGIFILKGNGTLIFDGENLELCRAGNPGMAIGGMGDVLTGTITALLAQGLTPFSAACLGVNLHAGAADRIAQQKGQVGLLPSELGLVYSKLLADSITTAKSRSSF
ncbi:NAD(P)H-hydrate dehydratase [Thiomicrorhabdus sp. 6S2-11]|uniref:Bifunctional NAD(P)H-hydrate repair enzyme n=1 Tax=Thiomicrorhabdus marina TaxID=2818442 RepID=A0ABS3Q3M7_9GAMM|nr:NAD(P)H-hydrate dehydratase [Thiomicrorhabdus marina]MBO1926936.1 NAD(P)H-hydrate dehydratase [Thiomicrorhabdus marina]